MKKVVAALGLLLLVVAGILLLRGNEDTWLCVNGQWVKHGHPSAPMPTTPCGLQSATPTVNPNVNIALTNPTPGQTITMPYMIRGRARVFENQLNFRVLDSKGNPLIEGTMTANAKDAGQFGDFQATINSVPSGKATIEVFDKSAKDGSEIDKVSTSVTVK